MQFRLAFDLDDQFFQKKNANNPFNTSVVKTQPIPLTTDLLGSTHGLNGSLPPTVRIEVKLALAQEKSQAHMKGSLSYAQQNTVH